MNNILNTRVPYNHNWHQVNYSWHRLKLLLVRVEKKKNSFLFLLRDGDKGRRKAKS
jgi:hypothetical protein